MRGDDPPHPPNIERRMRRLSNSPAQGLISGFVALFLLVVLSWVRGRNCATTLVGGSGVRIMVEVGVAAW
jgi:hypothetical protein